LATACAPIVIGATHIGNTTPPSLLAWAVVLLCVTTALLRHRPHWWLGAGAPPGAAHKMAMAGRRHRGGHLAAQRHLAGHARVAAAGHGLRPAPAEHLHGRLPGRAAGPAR